MTYANDAYRQMLMARAAEEERVRRQNRLLPKDWRYQLRLESDYPDPNRLRPGSRGPGPQSRLMQNFAPPKPEPLQMRPTPPLIDSLQQYHDEQLMRGMPPGSVPERMRPPIDVPDHAPEFYEDNWRRRVT